MTAAIKSRAVFPRDVGVDAEAAGAGAGVVLLADVGEVDVAQLILMVESDQKASVADRNVTRHAIDPSVGDDVSRLDR